MFRRSSPAGPHTAGHRLSVHRPALATGLRAWRRAELLTYNLGRCVGYIYIKPRRILMKKLEKREAEGAFKEYIFGLQLGDGSAFQFPGCCCRARAAHIRISCVLAQPRTSDRSSTLTLELVRLHALHARSDIVPPLHCAPTDNAKRPLPRRPSSSYRRARLSARSTSQLRGMPRPSMNSPAPAPSSVFGSTTRTVLNVLHMWRRTEDVSMDVRRLCFVGLARSGRLSRCTQPPALPCLALGQPRASTDVHHRSRGAPTVGQRSVFRGGPFDVGSQELRNNVYSLEDTLDTDPQNPQHPLLEL